MLKVSGPWVEILGQSDPFAKLASLNGEVYRQLEGRKTFRYELDGRGYFVKIHSGIGWGEIFKNLSQLRLPVLGARNEWLAITRLGELHIDTMKVVGFGERGINPARQQSFLITEELANTVSLEDFCRNWKNVPPPLTLKRTMIRQLGRIARTLHENGVNHRDFYLCHFLLDLGSAHGAGPNSSLKMYLIDLHRVQLRRRTPLRWIIKDIAGLYFSSADCGLTKRDVIRFLRAYRGKEVRSVLRKDRAMLLRIRRRAEALYRKTFGRAPKLPL